MLHYLKSDNYIIDCTLDVNFFIILVSIHIIEGLICLTQISINNNYLLLISYITWNWSSDDLETATDFIKQSSSTKGKVCEKDEKIEEEKKLEESKEKDNKENKLNQNEESTLIIFNIKKYCYNAGKINCFGKSYYRHENETLIPPFSVCIPKKIKKCKIKLDLARDNKKYGFDYIPQF